MKWQETCIHCDSILVVSEEDLIYPDAEEKKKNLEYKKLLIEWSKDTVPYFWFWKKPRWNKSTIDYCLRCAKDRCHVNCVVCKKSFYSDYKVKD